MSLAGHRRTVITAELGLDSGNDGDIAADHQLGVGRNIGVDLNAAQEPLSTLTR